MCGDGVWEGVELLAGEVVAVHGEEGGERVAGVGAGGMLGVELVEAVRYYGCEGGFS